MKWEEKYELIKRFATIADVLDLLIANSDLSDEIKERWAKKWSRRIMGWEDE